MLIWLTARRQLRIEKLMALYQEAGDQDYLLNVFFQTSGAILALWEQEGRYVSGLRLEPYRDGLLLAGLLTAPDQRRKGHARQLIQAVQEKLGAGGKLYSHVDKKNAASLAVHQKCGFRIIKDCARYLDGSVDLKCCTLLYE